MRFVGDEVAVVAAEKRIDCRRRACASIDVTYEVLPPVFDAEDALADGAPELHRARALEGNMVGGEPCVVERGDVRRGLASAARCFEGRFHTQMHGPVGMETRAALAEWDGDNLTVWKTSRAVHAVDRRRPGARAGHPESRTCASICTTMGGGFGNKDEGRLACYLAALLARKAGRPVRIEYSRAEEFIGRPQPAGDRHRRLDRRRRRTAAR